MRLAALYKHDENAVGLKLPLAFSPVSAGFPSPAGDYLDLKLDLQKLLVTHPAATFFAYADGDSMIGVGINHKDILVVDRAEEAREGSIVVASVDGEMIVKTLRWQKGHPVLLAENPKYKGIDFLGGRELTVWGVVTSCVHRFRK